MSNLSNCKKCGNKPKLSYGWQHDYSFVGTFGVVECDCGNKLEIKSTFMSSPDIGKAVSNLWEEANNE